MEYEISETCRQLLAQLAKYLDGELDASICEQVEQHLATCPYCRIVVDTTQKTITLFHAAPPEEVPQIVRQHLLKILELEE